MSRKQINEAYATISEAQTYNVLKIIGDDLDDLTQEVAEAFFSASNQDDVDAAIVDVKKAVLGVLTDACRSSQMNIAIDRANKKYK